MCKKKKIIIVIAALLLVLAIGIVWQQIMTKNDESRYPAPGEYIEVSDYRMHYVSKGTGETAVVFITGSGTPCAYTDFYTLQEALSSSAQTVSFDHAGSGWSSASKLPRTVENLEAELSALIDTAAGEKPVVLICHSLGSLEAIYYAQHHTEQVKGIVFLDSGSPEFYTNDSEFSATLLNRGTFVLRSTGLLRLLDCAGIVPSFYAEDLRLKALPDEMKEVDTAMYLKYAGNSQTLASVNEMNGNAWKVFMGSDLGDLPILVLSSDSGAQWAAVQEELAGWSSVSRRVQIDGASHYIHWSNEDVVTEQIVQFLSELDDFGG